MSKSRAEGFVRASKQSALRRTRSLVVEVAFNDIQASPHYPGGVALRFALVKHYRQDKRAQEADTLDTVRSLYRQQLTHQNACTRVLPGIP